ICKLVDDLELDILFPLYPLLPNHSFSEILSAIEVGYELLLKDYKPKDIQFFGLSSGASSCFYTFIYGKKNLPYPRHMVAFSPAGPIPVPKDIRGKINETDSLDPVLSPNLLDNIYPYMEEPGITGTITTLDPKIQDICPMTILMGTHEIFHPYLPLYREFAKKYQRDFTIIEGQGLIHCWIALLKTPEGRMGYEKVRDALKAYIN
ncbi:MAG: alpha/beta hydrolase fold domain-containing protein, partial [Tissierellia bacterium]|nr:alpha/beta hydrolase fold domain-containing protein [Tissierellia bacterium]